MELEKMTIEDIKGFDAARLMDAEKDLRQELAMLRMDVYATAGQNSAKQGKLKKNLARILTVRNERTNDRGNTK